MNEQSVSINELLEALSGYGTDNSPLTIGIFREMLLEIKQNKERVNR